MERKARPSSSAASASGQGKEAALASASRDSLLALARFADEATDGRLAGAHPPKLASVPPNAKGDGRPSPAPRGTILACDTDAPRPPSPRSSSPLRSSPLAAAAAAAARAAGGGGAGTGGSTAMTTTLHPGGAPCPARPRATVIEVTDIPEPNFNHITPCTPLTYATNPPERRRPLAHLGGLPKYTEVVPREM